jgi:prepilin-type N-terminal cleavage/methylation domain-containing protein
MPKHPSPSRRRHRRGEPRAATAFTLIELLVVIGIIAVLMSILIPVVAHVQQSARVAATRSRLIALQNGIEAYKQRFESYPGPLADNQLLPMTNNPANQGGPFTGSENLVLGLLGGLQIASGQIQFNPALVGRGPQSLNPLKIQTYGTMVDPVSAGLDPQKVNGAWKKWSDPAHPAFPNQQLFKDTDAPEFVDAFPDALPILYIRARAGVSGVVTTDGTLANSYPKNTTAAYNMLQLTGPYAFSVLPMPSGNPPWPDLNGGADDPLLPPKTKYTAYAPEYFGTPAPNYNQPKQKDGYLLISAGPDRHYGQTDDIVSGGEVKP